MFTPDFIAWMNSLTTMLGLPAETEIVHDVPVSRRIALASQIYVGTSLDIALRGKRDVRTVRAVEWCADRSNIHLAFTEHRRKAIHPSDKVRIEYSDWICLPLASLVYVVD